MTRPYIDRVAIRVPNLEEAIADFSRIFGMEFQVTEVAELGIKVGICDHGIELVEQIDPDSPVAPNWAGNVLASLSVKVDDIESVREKLLARGVELINEVDAHDFGELYCDSRTFHGLPLTVSRYGESFVKALHGQDEMPDDYEPKITWYKKEFAPRES